MIKEDYIISILGSQSYDDEPEEDSEISMDTFGSYAKRGGSRYITYKEFDENNPKIARTSVLKIEENSTVTMLKAGTNTRLILEKGKRHSCIYSTDFGPLTIGVYTKEVKNTLNDDGGELEIDYTIDINSTMSSNNKVHVKVKPAVQD